MKKIKYLFIAMVTALFFTVPSLAVDAPKYDPTYNNNEGAFYANGTSITINENEDGNTVINWDGGSQIVPETVTVFGGGSNGTNYEQTNIVMEAGTVSNIVAGGVSTEETKPATVGNANVVFNGGTILNKIAGGGYVYSEVDNSNIVVNDGSVNNVVGGGFASVTVNGVYYNVGTEEKPEESPNRVDDVTITINGGNIPIEATSEGVIYGGGQGYSYVGDTDLIINAGDLSNVYVTAGGSNGYTGDANVELNGGTIGFYQTVNRGIVDEAKVKLQGATVEDFYVGGETDAPDVTGTVNKVEADLLGGEITNLSAGKSDSQPITIDNKNYKVIKTDDVDITNDNIESGEVEITYDLAIFPESMEMIKGEVGKFEPIVTTTPAGYEELFDNVTWMSSDENIATVDSNGNVTGIEEGRATITASLLDKQATAEVTVNSQSMIFLLILWILVPLLIVALVGIIVLAVFG